MRKILNFSIPVFVLFFTLTCKNSAPEKADLMEWWREARFGLFIHWGLYSVPAREWNGELFDHMAIPASPAK